MNEFGGNRDTVLLNYFTGCLNGILDNHIYVNPPKDGGLYLSIPNKEYYRGFTDRKQRRNDRKF